MLASLDVPHGRGITYASIAAGRQDKQIRAWLTQAEQDAVTYHIPAVYVDFEHEANNPPNSVNGTPAQFIKPPGSTSTSSPPRRTSTSAPAAGCAGR